ncbi:hypothetical protein WI89_07005 [Burkholderia ubonensis]|nr:hypothetical protein WI89_07005 [Burkholderia ubonensis]
MAYGAFGGLAFGGLHVVVTSPISRPTKFRTMQVGLLDLAANHGVEAVLADRLDAVLTAGELPDL